MVYLGFVVKVADQMGLSIDVDSWWEHNAGRSPVQRFNDFLKQILLKELAEPVVIFVDEIDSTLGARFYG